MSSAIISRLPFSAIRATPALLQRRALATTRPLASNQNPSVGEFSFKNLTSNPRTRRVLIGVFAMLACIEAGAWYKFAPHVWGKKDEEDQDKQQ